MFTAKRKSQVGCCQRRLRGLYMLPCVYFQGCTGVSFLLDIWAVFYGIRYRIPDIKTNEKKNINYAKWLSAEMRSLFR